MGVTITVALGFWIASSYFEYRVIEALPWTKPFFEHPIGGIALSLVIGWFASISLGIPAGVGVTLGQLMGIATNKFTFAMYSNGSKALNMSRQSYQKAATFFHNNKERVSYALGTIKYGIKGIGVLILGFLWIVGLPFRVLDWFQRRKVGV